VRFRALQHFFNWCADEDELSDSPMVRTRPPVVPEQPVAVLTIAQLKALFATCSGKDFADPRFVSTSPARGDRTVTQISYNRVSSSSVTGWVWPTLRSRSLTRSRIWLALPNVRPGATRPTGAVARGGRQHDLTRPNQPRTIGLCTPPGCGAVEASDL
jgi:hypothetical protein